MEKLKNFFKSLIIRLVICENLVLASMLTQSLGTISYLFLCAIPVVLFWRIGILKLCWKIIKGFFSIFADGGNSNSSSNSVKSEPVQVKEPEPERKPRKEIVSAWQDGDYIFYELSSGSRGNQPGILIGYTSTTLTFKFSRSDQYPQMWNVDRL